MGGQPRDSTAEELLAHAGWLRRLALRLVDDADAADDLVQETWIAAARRGPEARESLRPWLAKVLRDALRMRARSEGRRAAREQAAALAGEELVATPELLVERAEAQRRLVELVLRLAEPYRSAVLLHYCEGVPMAEIARAQGIPAGTVRWRVKVAIDQLRAWLDEADDRRRWAVVLLALPKGVLVAQKTSKIAIIVLLLLLLCGGGIWLVASRGGGDGGGGRQAARDPAVLASGAAAWRGGDGGALALPAWLAQRGLAPRRIAGRVLGPDGAPVAGAAVALGNQATAGGLVAEARRVTGAGGTFDFGLQPAMRYTVRASAPGKTGDAETIDLRDPVARPPADRLELRLGPCDAALFGTVRDASGGPIAGARIAALPDGPRNRPPGVKMAAAALAVETGAAGDYQLCVVGGRSRLTAEVSAAGYGAIVLLTDVWGRQRFDFALVPEATVVGRVVRADDGAPVAQAYVSLGPTQWGVERSAPRAAFSDASGRFRIAGVAPGPHMLEAIADGAATARATPVLVEAGQVSEDNELILESRATVRGVVMDGKNPVAGAVVALGSDTLRDPADAVSQPDGSFVLERVPRGQVRFTARPYEVVTPKSFQVDRARHDGVVLEVDGLAAISGRVVRRGHPVEGALVEPMGPNADELAPIHADAGGHFVTRGLLPGTWKLWASSERLGAFGGADREFRLEAGSTAEVTIELTYDAAISGVVVDQTGAPIPAASVTFVHTGSDDAGFATSAEDGSFRAAMMSGSGAYRPVVRARSSSVPLRPAAGGSFAPIELADGDAEVTGVRLAVRFDRLVIAGRVVDEDGEPVADARVAAEPSEPGATPRFWRWLHRASATTDVDGRFAIGELAAGTYALEARASSGAEAIVGGVAAGRSDVALVLPSPGSIEGTLVGFARAPTVSALRQDSRAAPYPEGGAVSGTSFAIPSLSPGSYLVSATSDKAAASARVEVRAGEASRVTLTSSGSASVVGQVRDFRSGTPIGEVTC